MTVGPIGCPETSVRNYHSTLFNTQKDRRSPSHRRESLKLCTVNIISIYLRTIRCIIFIVSCHAKYDACPTQTFVPFFNTMMIKCSLCCGKWHYGSSVQDATPNLDLASRLTKERCLTIHSTIQSPVFWLDLQLMQCACNSYTEGSRKNA